MRIFKNVSEFFGVGSSSQNFRIGKKSQNCCAELEI
jgi:hypothetical protein